MSYRIAKSILRLFAQLNAAHPARSKASDGTIGDAAHASRDSDHNPWVMDGNTGVVTAGDITHDPAHGVDCNRIAEAIRAARDPRVKYIIWNRRICRSYPKTSDGVTLPAWSWGNYSGPNAHTKHAHISVLPIKGLYDDDARVWKLTLPPPTKDDEMTPAQAAQLAAIHDQTRANARLMVSLSNNLTALMKREMDDDVETGKRLAELKHDIDTVRATLDKP